MGPPQTETLFPALASARAWATTSSVFTIRSNNSQSQDRISYLLCFVNLVHPSCVTTAMQTVRTIILLQLDGVLTKNKLAVLDTICISAYA